MTINTKLFCNFVISNRDWLTYWLSDFESSPLNGRFAISGTTFSLLKSVKILKIFYDASSYCSAILPFHLRREFFSFQKMFNVTYDASSFRLTTLHLRREFFFFLFWKDFFSSSTSRVLFVWENVDRQHTKRVVCGCSSSPTTRFLVWKNLHSLLRFFGTILNKNFVFGQYFVHHVCMNEWWFRFQ